MAEIARLSGCSNWLNLEFVEREWTPSELMKLGIRLHLAGLSLSNTVSELEKFDVERSRKAIHDWIQKADLQPASDASPDQIPLDETVIRINGQQFWLYAAVDPKTNEFLHLRQFTATITALTQRFLHELRERYDVEDAEFLVDHAQHLAAVLRRSGLRFQPVRHGDRNSVEHIFREIKNVLPRSVTISATSIHQPPKRGSKPSQSGGIRLTKHDGPHDPNPYRKARPTSSGNYPVRRIGRGPIDRRIERVILERVTSVPREVLETEPDIMDDDDVPLERSVTNAPHPIPHH